MQRAAWSGYVEEQNFRKISAGGGGGFICRSVEGHSGVRDIARCGYVHWLMVDHGFMSRGDES